MRDSTGAFLKNTIRIVGIGGATLGLGTSTAQAIGVYVEDATFNDERGLVRVRTGTFGKLSGTTDYDPSIADVICNPWATGYLWQEQPRNGYLVSSAPTYTGGNLNNVTRSFEYSDLTQQWSWIFKDSFQVDCGRTIHVTTQGTIGLPVCEGYDGVWTHGTGKGHDLDDNVFGKILFERSPATPANCVAAPC